MVRHVDLPSFVRPARPQDAGVGAGVALDQRALVVDSSQTGFAEDAGVR